jgi:hypothetical protein
MLGGVVGDQLLEDSVKQAHGIAPTRLAASSRMFFA